MSSISSPVPQTPIIIGAVALAMLAAACEDARDVDTGAGATTTAIEVTTTAPTTTSTSLAKLTEPVDSAVFDYEANTPLNFVEDPTALTVPAPEADVHPITFDSPNGGQVTGLIAHPPEGDSDAAIILMHGMPETASAYIFPMVSLSCGGATVLAIDAPYARADRVSQPLTFTEQDRDEQIQVVVELRRVVDVLRQLGHERITFDGVSWSAAIGAILAGVEPRIDGYSLMMGGPMIDRYIRDGEPVFPLDQEPADVVEEWLAYMAPVDPIQFIGEATSPVLLQNGTLDTVVPPESAERLHAATGPTAEVRWYETDHNQSEELLTEHIQWQAEILELDTARVTACIDPLMEEYRQ